MTRARWAQTATVLARLAFAVTVFLISFRARLTLLPRPQPPLFADYTDFQLFANDVSLLATLALWGIGVALQPRPIKLAPLFLTLSILGITAAGMVSVLFSVDRDLSTYHFIRLAMLFGMYLFVLNEIKSVREIFLPIALAVFLQSTVGIAQVLRQHSLGLSSIGELALDPTWRGISTVWSGTAISLRAYGLTDHPNILGGCLAFALLFIGVAYIDTKSEWRIPIVGLVGLGGLALLMTFSRAAWLALGAGTGLTFGLLAATRQTRTIINWLALVAAGVIFVAPFAWQNVGYIGARANLSEPSMFTGENRAIVERDALNTSTLGILESHFLVGTGLGTVPRAMIAAYPNLPFDYQPAHFVLLDVAAETGIFGGLFYLAAMVAPWIAMGLNRRHLNWSPAFIGITGVLLGATLVGFFDYYTWLLVPGRLWQWFIWGIWGAAFTTSLSGARNA